MGNKVGKTKKRTDCGNYMASNSSTHTLLFNKLVNKIKLHDF